MHRPSFDFGPLVCLGILVYVDLRTWSILTRYLHMSVGLAGVIALLATVALGYGIRAAFRVAAADDEQRSPPRPSPPARPKGALPPWTPPGTED